MKLLKTIFAILCLGLSISAQTVITDNDSVTIKADADVSGVGKVEIQTQNVSRVTIANDGKIGLGITSPQAIFHFGGTSGLGFEQTMRLETNEEGTAPFGWTLAKYAGSNGESKQDNVFLWGYNTGIAGTPFVSGEHQWSQVIESRFKNPGQNPQLEYYWNFQPGVECVGVGCISQRPFSITADLVTGQIIPRLVGLHVMDLNNVQQTTFDTDINFWNPAGAVRFNGTRNSRHLIIAGGQNILSYKFDTANKVDLFSTGIGDPEIGLFGDTAPEYVSTLSFGAQSGVLSPNAVGFRKNGNKGMQVNHGSGWAKIATVLTPCAATVDPLPGERINNVTTIAILQCLRQLGLLAQ